VDFVWALFYAAPWIVLAAGVALYLVGAQRSRRSFRVAGVWTMLGLAPAVLIAQFLLILSLAPRD
jgi:hypothetical protein